MSRIVREWVAGDMGFRQKLTFVRFEAGQRLEHLVTLVSTAMLALTGLPQKFHEADISRWLISVMGGIDFVRNTHHIFAIILTMGAIYHVLAVGYGILVKGSRLTMLPTLKDATDALATVKYLVGLSKEKPHFDRFTFGEKLEYWALVWGTAIMAITGFIMWFPTKATQFIDGVWIPVSKMAHGWEAVLAVLSLMVWHMYHVHVKSWNTSMFTGKMSKEHMLEEHPLEYARLIAESGEAEVAPYTVVK
jgi:formate dehydrogenase subunit gamma